MILRYCTGRAISSICMSVYLSKIVEWTETKSQSCRGDGDGKSDLETRHIGGQDTSYLLWCKDAS